MKKIKRDQIQPIILEILKEFKKYSKKNKLTFFLDGGTLLGAVRHKGFIPWDDDIDISMVRKEFNKLINIAEKNPYIDSKKRYKILLPLSDGHIYPFIKIIDTKTIVYEKSINKKYATGLWIDIFPYDYVSSDKKEQQKIERKQRIYKMFLQIGISGELNITQKIKKAIAYPVYRVLTRGDYKFWVNKILNLISKKKTKNMGNIVWMLPNNRSILKSKWYDEFIELDFEDDKYLAPFEYDKCLTKIYGDYMTLPDEKDRQIHDFDAYYLDD